MVKAVVYLGFSRDSTAVGTEKLYTHGTGQGSAPIQAL